jgi:REP element-mobilizing transposase RayT
MARPLRIEYEGAWYHVMNRGRRAEKIFFEKQDYLMFIELLEEALQMWNIRIAAYCLMPNHYHILVQTPDGNIARSMRHINGVYTQRFNRKHDWDGPLFRGRYKSILVSADSHLLQLVRYIHRNPQKAGLADNLDDYPWSSHKGYLSVAKRWNWLYKEFIFSLLTQTRKEWVKRYRQFVAVEDEDDIAGVIEGKRWPSILGSESFIDWVKGKYYDLKMDEEVPQAKELAPEPEVIIKTVCNYYGVDREDLCKSRRGMFNEPKSAAIYLMRQLRRDTLQEIGKQFRVEKYSSVSSSIESTKQKMQKNRNLKRRLSELSGRIKKSKADLTP